MGIDLRKDEWAALAALTGFKGRHKPTQAELLKRLKWSAPKGSKVLKSLESLGFVARETQGSAKLVMLTRHGHALVQARTTAPPEEAQLEFLQDRVNNVVMLMPHMGIPVESGLADQGFVLNEAFRGSKLWSQRDSFDGVSVQLSVNHIIFHVNHFVAPDAWTGLQMAQKKVLRALDEVLRRVPGLRVKVEALQPGNPETHEFYADARRAYLKVRKQEHAMVAEPLAMLAHEMGTRVDYKDELGRQRFISDASTGRPELEAVHPQLSAEDFQRVQKAWLGSLVTGRFEAAMETPERVRSLDESRHELFEIARITMEAVGVKVMADQLKEERAEKKLLAQQLQELREQVERLSKMRESVFRGKPEDNPGYS